MFAAQYIQSYISPNSSGKQALTFDCYGLGILQYGVGCSHLYCDCMHSLHGEGIWDTPIQCYNWLKWKYRFFKKGTLITHDIINTATLINLHSGGIHLYTWHFDPYCLASFKKIWNWNIGYESNGWLITSRWRENSQKYMMNEPWCSCD